MSFITHRGEAGIYPSQSESTPVLRSGQFAPRCGCFKLTRGAMSLGRLELERELELELENQRGSSCGLAPLIVTCERGSDSEAGFAWFASSRLAQLD